MKMAILFVAFAALCGAQTTVNGGRDYKGTLKASGSVSVVDFTNSGSTAPAKAGTSPSRPTACTQGQMYFATDVAAGQNLYFCTVSGAPGVWTQMSGGGGGSGTTAYVSPLITGPDLTRTITGGTHGFTTTALLVGVYDNASPRNAISAGWTVHPTTHDVGITFASPQSNYYVVINGGIGPVGPVGPTGPAGPSATGGAGAVQTSNGSSGLVDGGCTMVSGVINCVPVGGAAGSHAFPQGTANAPPANSVMFQAPTSVPSAYGITLPSAPAAGYVKRTNANPSVESVSAIADADLPARERHFVITGSGASGVLQDTDDQPAVWFNQSGGNMTITNVWCLTDSATATTIQLQKDDGSPVDMLSSNLSCTSTKATTASFVSGENMLANGNNLTVVVVSAGAGSPHWVAVHIKVTY